MIRDILPYFETELTQFYSKKEAQNWLFGVFIRYQI